MHWRRILGGIAFAVAAGGLAAAAGQPDKIAWTIAITSLTAFWWVSEALPIPATSLVPFALFPMAGVLSERAAAAALGNYVIILLMASFMLSKALEKSGAHERLALYMIRLVGASGRRLVFGFMIASAFISMWVANTATTLMLTPIALAILARTESRALDAPVLLGVAYAASIGGVGTLIGTPPNLIFAGVYQQLTGVEYGFVEWMKTGVPIVLISIPIAAFWLTRNLNTTEKIVLPAPGRWTQPELRTLLVFAVAIVLWITRTEPFGGWSALTGIVKAGDSTVAIAAVAAMFLIPDGRRDAAGKRTALLDWKSANDIPWGMLLLFAGGICIAAAFEESGLSAVLGSGLTTAKGLPVFALMLAICLGITFMSELTSNTAIATLMLPVLAAGAGGTGLPAETLMVPAAIAASSGFMLPVSTAPNTIVYATGRVSIARMAREGIALNFIVAVVIASICWATLR
ncbi:MAG: SLC13 family permease [Parvularculaceae bacterium]